MNRKPGPASKLEIFGWCMFDFANSSYTTMIATFTFALYFVETVAGGRGYSEQEADFLWGLGAGLSQAVVLVTAPIVGAIADHSAGKKRFLLLTYVGCVLGTASLGLVGPGDVVLGLVLFIISNVFYSSGENIVAGFLPEIARKEQMGRVSGLGWALGYMGGLGSLAVCAPLLKGGVGAEQASSVQLSFVVVAAFFLVGGLPTFLFLRERATAQPLPVGRTYLKVGFARVRETLGHVRSYRQLFRFLFVFLVYSCGINIVVNFANIFAKREMGMDLPELLVFFILLQLAASAGALLFGWLQDRMSSKLAIQLSLVLWIAVCLGGYFTTSKEIFYAVGVAAGAAMGSSQSAARALVGSFSPVERSGEFFGFWGLFWKLGGVGPFFFGTVRLWAGTRTAILFTGIFFLFGLIGMFFIDEKEGMDAARQAGVKSETS